MENVELTHWGIKGMRWGVRRYQNRDGTLTNRGKKRYNSEMEKLKTEERILKNKARTSAKIEKLEAKRREVEAMKKGPTSDKDTKPSTKPKKSIKDMSDDELSAAINRIRMEQTYKSLTADPKKTSGGKDFAMEILKNSGKNVLGQLTVWGMGTAVNKIAGENIVNPKKGQKDK